MEVKYMDLINIKVLVNVRYWKDFLRWRKRKYLSDAETALILQEISQDFDKHGISMEYLHHKKILEYFKLDQNELISIIQAQSTHSKIWEEIDDGTFTLDMKDEAGDETRVTLPHKEIFAVLKKGELKLQLPLYHSKQLTSLLFTNTMFACHIEEGKTHILHFHSILEN